MAGGWYSKSFLSFFIFFSDYCMLNHCKYLFVLDADVVMKDPQTLKILIQQNR